MSDYFDEIDTKVNVNFFVVSYWHLEILLLSVRLFSKLQCVEEVQDNMTFNLTVYRSLINSFGFYIVIVSVCACVWGWGGDAEYRTTSGVGSLLPHYRFQALSSGCQTR